MALHLPNFCGSARAQRKTKEMTEGDASDNPAVAAIPCSVASRQFHFQLFVNLSRSVAYNPDIGGDYALPEVAFPQECTGFGWNQCGTLSATSRIEVCTIMKRLLRPLLHVALSPFKHRAIGFSVIFGLAFLSLEGYRFAIAQETQGAYKLARDAQQGKQIAPVPLNMDGKSADLVYTGSYLVNGQMGCNSCHTCPAYKGSDPFKLGTLLGPLSNRPSVVNTANYMAGGVPFPGKGVAFAGSVIAAPNLTPDSKGLPGGMTYDDFKDAMQNGSASSKPGHVLQVMPWPIYQNLHEQDLVAIYQYLSAIPPAKPGICSVNDETGR